MTKDAATWSTKTILFDLTDGVCRASGLTLAEKGHAVSVYPKQVARYAMKFQREFVERDDRYEDAIATRHVVSDLELGLGWRGEC